MDHKSEMTWQIEWSRAHGRHAFIVQRSYSLVFDAFLKLNIPCTSLSTSIIIDRKIGLLFGLPCSAVRVCAVGSKRIAPTLKC